VPSPLRLAALRRAWSSDPAIRDFKGLAEYDWDFTAPGSMAGFGELDPGTDVQKMLSEMFGDTPAVPQAAAELPEADQIVPQRHAATMREPADETTQDSNADVEKDNVDVALQVPPTDNKSMVQREENIAVQDRTTESPDSDTGRRRSQGSALPQ